MTSYSKVAIDTKRDKMRGVLRMYRCETKRLACLAKQDPGKARQKR